MKGLADRQAIEQLAQLLDAPDTVTGQPADHRVAALLSGVQTLQRLPLATGLDAEAHARARRRLVAVAAVQPANGPAATEQPRHAIPARPLWQRKGVLVGVGGVAAVLVVGAVGVVATQSQPGGPAGSGLAGTAEPRGAVAGSEIDRGRTLLSMAGTKLSEATRSDDPTEQAATLRSVTTQWTQGFRLLSTAAVMQRSQAPLKTAAGYLRQQRPPVVELVGTASNGTTHAAAVSTLRLLDAVQTRVDKLSSTLQCATIARADALGPLPGTCTPGHTGASSAPGGGTGPVGGGTSTAPTASAAPSHGPSAPASPSPSTSIGGSVSPTPTPTLLPTPSSTPSLSPSASPSPSPSESSPTASPNDGVADSGSPTGAADQ